MTLSQVIAVENESFHFLLVVSIMLGWESGLFDKCIWLFFFESPISLRVLSVENALLGLLAILLYLARVSVPLSW
jgi:hypothetical protein